MSMLDQTSQAKPTTRGTTLGMTVVQARRALSEMFRRSGLDSPELDARLLTGHALGLDHTGLTIEAGRLVSDDEARAIDKLAERRLEREPVARILGHQEFWGLALRSRPLRVADLGTGSGALLVALRTELPNADGVGTDISFDALTTARDNARKLQLDRRAHFAACDFGAALSGPFDLVVSNPPYVVSGDIAGLAPEVRRDPRRALDGGSDGLDCYRTIAGQVARLLKPGGHLVVELGFGQEAQVAATFRAAGLAPRPAYTDLAGIPRALKAVAPESAQ